MLILELDLLLIYFYGLILVMLEDAFIPLLSGSEEEEEELFILFI